MNECACWLSRNLIIYTGNHFAAKGRTPISSFYCLSSLWLRFVLKCSTWQSGCGECTSGASCFAGVIQRRKARLLVNLSKNCNKCRMHICYSPHSRMPQVKHMLKHIELLIYLRVLNGQNVYHFRLQSSSIAFCSEEIDRPRSIMVRLTLLHRQTCCRWLPSEYR